MEINLKDTQLTKEHVEGVKGPRLPKTPNDQLKQRFRAFFRRGKRKLKTPRRTKGRRSLYIGLGVLLILGTGGYLFYKELQRTASGIGVEIDAGSVLDALLEDEPPELKKDSSGIFTNALLVGIDTRNTDKGLKNTDTLIITSYNHETKETVMFSIPRDTYVEVPLDSGYYNRINSVYAEAEAMDEDSGLPTLTKGIERYMGLEIQYYVMIDYQGFETIINIIGDLTIDVENSFTDYRYPTGARLGDVYQTIHFDAGLQKMNGEQTLQYARSRKSLDNGEGSDYARARRQQKVIAAVKDKLLSSDTWLSPKKVSELLTAVQGNIKVSPMNTRDLQAGLDAGLDAKGGAIYSFVFDPIVGNRKVIKQDPASYAILPNAGLGDYTDTSAFVQAVLATPKVYQEQPTVYVYDIGLGYYPTLEKVNTLRDKYPYITIVYGGTLFYDKTGDHVYMNGDDSFTSSLEFFVQEYSITDKNRVQPSFVTTRLNGEDIVILLGAPVPEPTPTQDEVVE